MKSPVRARGALLALVGMLLVSVYALLAPSPAVAQSTPSSTTATTATTAPASAAPVTTNAAPTLTLFGVNSLDPNNVLVVNRYTGNANNLAKTTARENDKAVTISSPQRTLLEANLRNGVVFMFDTSKSTDNNGTLAEARTAARSLMQTLPKGTQFAVIAAGSDSQVVQKLTSDTAAIDKAITSLTPHGDGALWEGVATAAAQFKDQPDLYGSVVLFTDGNDGKGVSYSDAQGAVSEVGVPVYSLAVNDGKLNGDTHRIAEQSGGAYYESTISTDLPSSARTVEPSLAGLYTFTYKSSNRQGVTDLLVNVDNVQTRSSFVAGSDSRGIEELAYQPPASSSGIEVTALQNDAGKYLAIILGLFAAGLAAYAVISIFVKENTGLSNVLQPYSAGYVAPSGDDEDDDGQQAMAQTALMQRAVEFTEQFAESRGFLSTVEASLERANLPLRAAEAMVFYLVAAVIVVLLSAAIFQNFLIIGVVILLAFLLPPAALNNLASRRKRQFEMQLPDTLQLLSGTLRAGYSMMQGVEAVSQEVEEPMGRELRRVVTEARLGRPLEQSLDAVAERMGSPDFGWAVMAIRIQREVGGNLSELLMTVADTMLQRERLKRDIKALTAEGRVSAYVLGILPIALGIAMAVINPDYMQPLFDETVGRVMLGVGLLMMAGGFFWMQKIVQIDV